MLKHHLLKQENKEKQKKDAKLFINSVKSYIVCSVLKHTVFFFSFFKSLNSTHTVKRADHICWRHWSSCVHKRVCSHVFLFMHLSSRGFTGLINVTTLIPKYLLLWKQPLCRANVCGCKSSECCCVSDCLCVCNNVCLLTKSVFTFVHVHMEAELKEARQDTKILAGFLGTFCLNLTLLVVQVEVAVFISTGDRIRDAIPVWIVGVDDGDQRIRTSVLT